MDAAAGDVDAETGDLVCLHTSSACDAANRADAAIRAQFGLPQYRCTDGAQKCGTVSQDGTTVTYPMICRAAVWRLAGLENYPGGWVASFECSKACGAAGTICSP
jgi:hypothetical protein